MKRLLPILAAVTLLSCIVHEHVVATSPPGPAPDQPLPTEPPPATPELFEGALAPYGQWIVVAPYGRVWRPAGLPLTWRPYFYGEWAWTMHGWFWVTDEPWGWATYHYGHWAWEPVHGWIWIPGYEWAPAWVAWRFGDGFVGWAPLGPLVGVWWDDPLLIGSAYWVFVPMNAFVGVRVERVVVLPARVPELVARTRPAPPPARAPPPRGAPAPAPWGGPARALVEQQAGRPVPQARLDPVRTPAEARGRGARGGIPAYAPPPAPREPGPAPAPAPGHVSPRPAPAPGAAPPARAAPPEAAGEPRRTAPPAARPAPPPGKEKGDKDEDEDEGRSR